MKSRISCLLLSGSILASLLLAGCESPEERSHRLDMEPIVKEQSIENSVPSKDTETYLVAMFIGTGFSFEITSFETYPKRDAVTLYLKEPTDIDGYKTCEMSTHLSNVVILKCYRE
jgi:hypothetical protein